VMSDTDRRIDATLLKMIAMAQRAATSGGPRQREAAGVAA
jgi:hypothetical protein